MEWTINQEKTKFMEIDHNKIKEKHIMVTKI
jgi:hypothetical protein